MKRIKWILCGTLILALLLGNVQAVEIDNAFATDFNQVQEEYEDAYNWNLELKDAFNFDITVTDSGNTYTFERQNGYQAQYYKDIINSTRKYLGLSDTSASGGDIVSVALSQVGLEESLENPARSNHVKYNEWYWGKTVDSPWCCAFVTWCANECGLIDDGTFTKTASCSVMYSYLTSKGFDSYRMSDTVQMGGAYEPVPGDIVFWYNPDAENAYGHIGIVEKYENGTLYVIEGNSDGSHAFESGATPGGGVAINMYSGSGCCSYCAGFYQRGYIVHVEYPDPENLIYNYLVGTLELNDAASCGILANIYCESGFNCTAENSASHAYGICQWLGARKTNLIQWCEENGYSHSTLTGQLAFMAYEMPGRYDMLSKMQNIENSASSAYDAGYLWCTYFEGPSNDPNVVAQISDYRGLLAKNTFWPKYGD